MVVDQSRDPLTGIYNRRYAFAALELLISQAERQPRELAIGMIDIDGFRRVNDLYGHAFGDDLLWEIARVLEICFSRRNMLARIGGNEFLVVFDGAPQTHVHSLAERARREVRRFPLKAAIRQTAPLSVTIGLAFYPENGRSPDDLLGAADRALYEGRSMGGNHVISA